MGVHHIFNNYYSYLDQITSVLCLYEKKITCDISNLHNRNHGNGIILELLLGDFVGRPTENCIHIYLIFFIYSNQYIKLCNAVVWLN